MDEKKILGEMEETESAPIDEKRETINFPWLAAIIIGVLMILIVACIIVIKVLEPNGSSDSSASLAAKIIEISLQNNALMVRL